MDQSILKDKLIVRLGLPVVKCFVLIFLCTSCLNVSAQKKPRKPRFDTIVSIDSVNAMLSHIRIFDKDSNLREVGVRVNNLRTGIWKRYSKKSGLISAISNYNSDLLEGVRVMLDVDGRIKGEENYLNGKMHGIQKEYGTVWGSKIYLKSIKEYLNGELYGTQLEYRKEDQLLSELNYIQGEKHGWSKWYYSNGQVSLEQEYTNGNFNGLQRAFYESGGLKKEGLFVNGDEEGEWKDYHENGVVKSSGLYKSGEKKGIWKSFDENSNLISKDKF